MSLILFLVFLVFLSQFLLFCLLSDGRQQIQVGKGPPPKDQGGSDKTNYYSLLKNLGYKNKLIKKLSLYVEEVTDASNLLFDQKTEYIKLSPELSVAEENLNCLKREYEKSERLSKENEQKKNDLMVYLAHDIKTPLTSMIGYLSLLDEIDDMPKSKRQKYIKIAC